MLTIHPKYQPFLEMHPNQPIYLNNKVYRQPISVPRKQIKDYSVNTIDYEDDVLRKHILSRSNRIREQAMFKLQYDNALLQAELARYQNKCQLAENQLMYQCLAHKTTEYQQLISKLKELPSLKGEHHHRYSKSINVREHRQSQNVSQVDGESFIDIQTERKQQIQKIQKHSETMVLQNVIQKSQNLQFQNTMDVCGKPQNDDDQEKVASPNPMRSAESVEIEEKPKIIEQSAETKRRIKKNIRIWRIVIWYIVGAYAFIKVLKLKQKRDKIVKKQKHSIALKYKQEISNLHQKKFQSQIYDWVSSVIGKVVTTLQKGLFLDDLNKMLKLGYEHKLFIDFRRQSIAKIAKFTFESLMLASHPSQFPEILQKHMILHLFKGYNKKPSLFVSQRTQYFTKNLNDLSLKEQQMIATEYFLFSIFIPNIIQCFNSQKYQSLHHEMECKMLVKILISWIQIEFMILYQKMPRYKQMSVTKVVQQNFVPINPEAPQLELNMVDEIDQKDQQIIYGLFDQSFFVELIQERKKIQFQLKELMKKITENISKILKEHIQTSK